MQLCPIEPQFWVSDYTHSTGFVGCSKTTEITYIHIGLVSKPNF